MKIDYKQKVKCKNKVNITMKVKEYFNKLIEVMNIQIGEEWILPDVKEYVEGEFKWIKLFC